MRIASRIALATCLCLPSVALAQSMTPSDDAMVETGQRPVGAAPVVTPTDEDMPEADQRSITGAPQTVTPTDEEMPDNDMSSITGKPPAAPPVQTNTSKDLPSPPPEEVNPHYNVVVLQGLNKVTGKTSTLKGMTGETVRFGNIEIIPHRCWKAPPDERPENAALLQISELKTGEQPTQIFAGWMFSSSPGLSGLEHPVYDITVVNCEASKGTDADDKPDAAKDAAKPAKTEKPAKKPAAPAKKVTGYLHLPPQQQ